MDTIKSIYTPLMKENSMKHIEYKTFNSIQTVANPSIESRYTSLQSRVANLVRKNISNFFIENSWSIWKFILFNPESLLRAFT